MHYPDWSYQDIYDESMKKIIYLALTILFSVMSCQEFDDSAIWDKLEDHENRIAYLEELCKQMNTNISSLQTIVTALQNNDYVTAVIPITKNNETIGYTISFAKALPITIFHGEDGKDGENGTNGVTPVLGVKQDVDGKYYWTIDGEYILASNGNKIPTTGTDGTDGISPILKIEDGYWWVSYNQGKEWDKLGRATEEDEDPIFQEIEYDDDHLYITLSHGEKITLLRCKEGDCLPVTVIDKIGVTKAIFCGHLDVPKTELQLCQVTIYYDKAEKFHITTAAKKQTIDFDDQNNFEIIIDVSADTEYIYCVEVESKTGIARGSVKTFVTNSISIDCSATNILSREACLEGNIIGWDNILECEKTLEIHLYVEQVDTYQVILNENIPMDENGTFSVQLSNLDPEKEYYYELACNSGTDTFASSFSTIAFVPTDDDRLTLLAIGRQLGMQELWDESENIENWKGVELWEDGPYNGRVRKVEFCFCNTSHSLPYEIQFLTTLEELIIFGNVNHYLHSLSTGEYVTKLTNLKRLTIEGYGLTELHPDFANLNNLEYLNLDSNCFDEIPQILTRENFPNLHALSLRLNQRYAIYDLSNNIRVNIGGFVDDNLALDKGMRSFKQLLKWDNLDTLQLSINYLQGQLPDMSSEGLPMWTFEELKDSLSGNLTSLHPRLSNIPKVLPNMKRLSLNFNRLSGNLPDWLLFHPNLDLWYPFAYIFTQEGKDERGQVAGFSNEPTNLNYYYEIYQGKEGYTIVDDNSGGDENIGDDDNIDEENCIRLLNSDQAISAGATLERVTAGELYNQYYDSGAEIYHLIYTQEDRPIRIVLPSQVKAHTVNPYAYHTNIRVNDTVYSEYFGPNNIIGEVVLADDNSVTIYMDLPDGVNYIRGNINFLDSSNNLIAILICTIDTSSK